MPDLATTIVPARPDTGSPSPDWRSHAACREANPTIFTSPHSAGGAWLRYCDRCLVAELCLWQALADEAKAGYRFGVRGGCTPARRDRIARSLPATIDFEAAYQAAVTAWAPR